MAAHAAAQSPPKSPLRRKGRGALMAAAAAEQKGIIAAGGEVPDQFANWRSVKSRVRAGGKLAAMALELQQTLGSSPPGAATAPRTSTRQEPKRTAAQVGAAVSPVQAKRRKGARGPGEASGKQTGRPLPPKYAQLEALFRKLEGVCSLLASRKKACTFENVRKPLEDTTGRRFTLPLLAQLVGVHPDAFTLHYMPARRPAPACAGTGLLTDAQTPPGAKWELRILLQPVPPAAVTPDQGAQPDRDPALVPSCGPSALQEQSQRRVQAFRERLRRAAETAHRSFLHQHALPDTHGWHPAFDLDQVPDIPCAPLPSPPGSRAAPCPATAPASAACSPSSELAVDPAARSPSSGHAGSPFGPLEPRPTRVAGPPTPRSLAATFDLVAGTTGDARGDMGRKGSRRLRASGPGEEPSARERHEPSGATEEQGAAGRTHSNPYCIDSRGGSSRGKQTSTSSATDSDCRVIESAGCESGAAASPTVWLPAGGEAAAASLQGVPLDILRQVAAKQRRQEADNGAAAMAQRRRRRMLAQLPGLVNLLRSVAQEEGRCVLRQEQLLARLVRAHPRLTDQGEVLEQLALLRDLAPTFLSSPTATAAAAPLLRINLNADMVALKRTLTTAV
ncbi:putative DNA replication factor Cdt1 [Klebsormidium nitens]|uniref:Putative DNA replication factor Cdt1 n=1 Tax=Klebsormidium nitens TaxID=105231 RepID=A0A1Y1IN40_KLENI|nr:putative DNA replication factor Cdt1 [Klebsormidium nitens]|eukprot:GAQ90176.1 putative DNA replication factor Cdt1 [Klebsormidium nitens]